MKELIEIILEKILNAKEVPEDLLYEFSQKTMQIVQKKATEEIPDEFWNFENYVEMFWRGKKYNYMCNPYLIYQMGQLLTCTNMLGILVDEKEKETSLRYYANLLKNEVKVFAEMYNERGIAHKELAKLSGLSVSELFQFVNRIKSDGFFTYRVMGREKYYYLTEYGKELYLLMLENNKKKKKYAKLRRVFDEINEIANDSYYKVATGQNKNMITKSVYITNQESSVKKIEQLIKISISKNVLDSNKEEEIWETEKKEPLKRAGKIS